jgi:hypothetical protein
VIASLLLDEIEAKFAELLAKASRVRSLAEFDKQVAAVSVQWRDAGRSAPRMWFRGHRNVAWPLTPSALRQPFHSLDLKILHGMFVEFRRRAIGIIDHEPRTTWGWLYLAQHHGFPTSLLDWTESSHVALLFALLRKPGTPKKREQDACVWLLNPGELNQRGWGFSSVVTVTENDASELLNPVLHGTPAEKEGKPAALLSLIPEYVTERLRAQRGAFVAFAWEPEGLMRTVVEGPDRLAELVVIPADAVAALEEELDVAGIAESTIFPDLDGLSAELARRHDHAR